jgi:hypothetical protein
MAKKASTEVGAARCADRTSQRDVPKNSLAMPLYGKKKK